MAPSTSTDDQHHPVLLHTHTLNAPKLLLLLLLLL
jgi:hypothetical protein